MAANVARPLPELRLAAVRIQDFRAIEHLVVELDRVTVLVGENNAGKTSILEALATGMRPRRGSIDDLRIDQSGDPSERFVIDLRIEPVDDEDFDEELTEILGTAVQVPDEGPQFVVLRASGRHSPTVPGRLDERRQFMQGWAADRAAGDQLVAVARPVPQAWGQRVLFQLLDAQRDLGADLGRRGSFWGRATRDPQLPGSSEDEIRAALHDLGGRIAAESPVLQQLREQLQAVVDTAADGDVELRPLPTQPEALLRALDVLVRAPGSAPVPIGLQGSGTRSLAALMVFRAYVLLERQRAEGQQLVVTALEEIEAHLHPQAQRAVASLLQELPGQVLLSTQSPYVIDRADLGAIRIVRRERAGVQIGSVAGLNTGEVEHARRWVQRHQGEVLFARLAVLVEGEAEESMFEPFAERQFRCPPGHRGISVVNVDGAQNFKQFATVLERLGVAWFILADGDPEGESGVKKAGEAVGQALDAGSPQVMLLPDAHSIGPYLVSAGFRTELEAAAAEVHGPGAVRAWGDKRHGSPAKGDRPDRDYRSAGWENRLIIDFLVRYKTGWGAAFARACLAHDPARVPPAIAQSLAKIDVMLGASP